MMIFTMRYDKWAMMIFTMRCDDGIYNESWQLDSDGIYNDDTCGIWILELTPTTCLF